MTTTMFYYDIYYWIILLPCLILAMLAQANVSSTARRFDQVRNRRGITGAQAAEMVLRANGVFDVRIESVSGRLSDHYDPRSNTIRLSGSVYGAATVSAVGVAAHEAGHAVQYAQGYLPIRIRSAVIPASNFGTQISFVLILIGLILYSELFFALGVAFFGLAVFAQIITLPVEFNASRRALISLEGAMILDENELGGARKVLRAAALTYVAALLVSLAHLLRYVLMFLGNRGRRR